jgi:hypothetical protein
MIEWIPGAWHQWWLVRKRRMAPVDYTEEWQRFRWAYYWPKEATEEAPEK